MEGGLQVSRVSQLCHQASKWVSSQWGRWADDGYHCWAVVHSKAAVLHSVDVAGERPGPQTGSDEPSCRLESQRWYSLENWSPFLAAECVCMLSCDSCDPVDCSPPGSSVHGISQARIPEWVAIPFFRGSSWPKDRTQVSCITGRFFAVRATRETALEHDGAN